MPIALAINGGMLTGLLVAKRAPLVTEEALLVVSLEQAQPRRQQPSVPRRAGADGDPDAAVVSQSAQGLADGGVPVTSPGSPAIDPQWVIGDGAYLRSETADPARRLWDAAEQRRYRRACMGLSSEHMTPDERDRCHGDWGGDKSGDQKHIGQREIIVRAPGPPSIAANPRFAREAKRQQRCRSYRQRTLPGVAPVAPPSLREGGCM